MVHGTKADAEALREEIAGVLSTMGLRLSQEKTLITHIDEGLDFLGWRIQRHRKRGTDRHYVYTYPARKSVKAVTAQGEDAVPTRWTRASRSTPCSASSTRRCGAGAPTSGRGLSSATFGYLSHYVWRGCGRWLRRKHRRSGWKDLRRRYCGGGWWPAAEERSLFDPGKVSTTRYRYRGAVIPTPWPTMG